MGNRSHEGHLINDAEYSPKNESKAKGNSMFSGIYNSFLSKLDKWGFTIAVIGVAIVFLVVILLGLATDGKIFEQ
jgi:hypothetical protein